MSRPSLYDIDPPIEVSRRGSLEALNYHKLLSRFDTLIHDEAVERRSRNVRDARNGQANSNGWPLTRYEY